MTLPIQNPYPGRLLQRAFNLQGSVRPHLSEEIIPVVQIADLGDAAYVPSLEYQATATWDIAAGGAGTSGRVRFEIPGGVIARIDEIMCRPAANSFIRYRFSNVAAAPGAAVAKSFTDGRLLQAGLEPSGVVTAGADVSPFAPEYRQFANATDVQVLKPGWLIGSGVEGQFGFFEFYMENTNQVFTGAIRWTEYQLV
jgi:hypothetical protein